SQKLYFSAIWIFRDVLVVLPRERPNSVFVMMALSGNPKVGVFVAFCISSRYSRLCLSVIRTLLPIDKLRLKDEGIVKKFLPVFPSLPGAGIENIPRVLVAASKA